MIRGMKISDWLDEVRERSERETARLARLEREEWERDMEEDDAISDEGAKMRYGKIGDKAKHRHMIGALASHMAIDMRDRVDLWDFRAAGLRWRRGDDGSYSAADRGRLRFELRVERFDYPQNGYSADYWTLLVEGLGEFSALRARHAPDERYFGSLATAFDLVGDYRAAARSARGEPDTVELVKADIDKIFARARAAGQRLKALSDGVERRAKPAAVEPAAADGGIEG